LFVAVTRRTSLEEHLATFKRALAVSVKILLFVGNCRKSETGSRQVLKT